jgi:hypothetical protein
MLGEFSDRYASEGAGIDPLMSEGKNLSLQRCASVKGTPSRRKQRKNDREHVEHVAEKLQQRLPKFNHFSQNGVFGRDS